MSYSTTSDSCTFNWYSTSSSDFYMPYHYSTLSVPIQRCPICNEKIPVKDNPRCPKCNRDLVEFPYANALNNETILPLKNPILWLDSFEDIYVCISLPYRKDWPAADTITLKRFSSLPTTLNVSPLTNRLQITTNNFPIAAYHILVAWKQRDKTKRYRITTTCISRLLKLDFKEIERAYIISTL